MPRRGSVLALLLVLTAAVLVTATDTPGPTDGQPAEQIRTLPAGQVVSGQMGEPADTDHPGRLLLRTGDGAIPRGRPARTGTVPGENLHSPVPHRIGSDFATTQIMDAATIMGDVALPWTFHLSRQLGDRRAQRAVIAGVADWDDVPGSRWAARHAGTSDQRTSKADGESLIFLERSCEGTTNANTYVFTDGGLGLYRYGARGTMVVEADIGLCPRLTDPDDIRRTVRHEVGHVVGLSHLCDRGEECHLPSMDDANQCSTMFWQSRRCQTALDAGTIAGLQTLYSVLRPLTGPTEVDATARTSFAAVEDGSAATVVVSAPGAPGELAASAAALAARTGGTWLLGDADEGQCLTDTVRAEVNRALARRGTLTLVGSWPESCRQLAFDWDLQLEIISPTPGLTGASGVRGDGGAGQQAAWRLDDLVRAELEMATIGDAAAAERTPMLVLSPSTAGTAVHAAAAALAAAVSAPALHTREGLLPASVLDAVQAHRPERVLVVGQDVDAPLAAQLQELATEVEVLSGTDDVDTILQAAARARSAVGGFWSRPGEVVLISAADTPTSLGAAALATARHAVVIATGDAVDDRVVRWLDSQGLAAGWALGTSDLLPEATVRAYAAKIG